MLDDNYYYGHKLGEMEHKAIAQRRWEWQQRQHPGRDKMVTISVSGSLMMVTGNPHRG